jgi:hypothetical protein
MWSWWCQSDKMCQADSDHFERPQGLYAMRMVAIDCTALMCMLDLSILGSIDLL